MLSDPAALSLLQDLGDAALLLVRTRQLKTTYKTARRARRLPQACAGLWYRKYASPGHNQLERLFAPVNARVTQRGKLISLLSAPDAVDLQVNTMQSRSA